MLANVDSSEGVASNEISLKLHTCLRHEPGCLQEVLDITQEHARQRIQQLACSLHGLALSSQVFAARVRSLVWDLENRMVQLEVPMWAGAGRNETLLFIVLQPNPAPGEPSAKGHLLWLRKENIA